MPELGEENERDTSPSPGRLRTLTRLFGSKATWTIATLSAAIAGSVPLVKNVDELRLYFERWGSDREYRATLQHPHPDILKEEVIATWSSGEIMLAMSQIDGYLGRLKDAPSWMKLCLTKSGVFPETHVNQYNDKIQIAETYNDRKNQLALQQRLDRIDIDKIEDGRFLQTSDAFQRLLRRSGKQFLSRYKQSEISHLAPAELYLLRNAIYGQYGYRFDTPKLRKFAYRMGWNSKWASFKPELVTRVERCNAFFLQELHPVAELGALGRGVLIRLPKSAASPRLLKSAFCTCLSQSKVHVDCRENPGGTNESEFRDYVDLIIDIVQGETNTVSWTFLDERSVAAADIDSFRFNQDKFFSAALDVSVALQAAFRDRSFTLAVSDGSARAAFWGVQLTLAGATVDRMGSDPGFMRDVADKMCVATREALELAGPHIPRVEELTPTGTSDGIGIVQKSIIFDNERIALTKEYVKKHYGLSLAEIEFTPRAVVVHSAGSGSLGEVYDRMKNPKLESARADARHEGPEANVSVHYLIDTDGAIYSLMKDFYIARHATGIGHLAIGIANIGVATPTEAQIAANAQLIRFLKKRYDSIEWVVASPEVATLKKSSFWEEKERDDAFENPGPGAAFMTKLRLRLGDLKLGTTPQE